MTKINGNTPCGICLTADSAITDPNHRDRVRFMPVPRLEEIPPFLEWRRSRMLKAIEVLVVQTARAIALSDECRITIRNYQAKLELNWSIGLALELAHERAMLKTWEIRVEHLRQDIRSIARRLAA